MPGTPVDEAPDDASLIAQIRRGDHDAYGALVQRHWHTAWGSAWAVLGNASDTEEIAQETFVQVYAKLDALREPSALGGWVWRIARDTALKHIRKHRRVRPHADLPESPDNRAPVDPLLAGEERLALAAALDDLPADMREALTMRFWEELDYPDMARRAGISEAAMYQRVCRGLKRLREAMGKDAR